MSALPSFSSLSSSFPFSLPLPSLPSSLPQHFTQLSHSFTSLTPASAADVGGSAVSASSAIASASHGFQNKETDEDEADLPNLPDLPSLAQFSQWKDSLAQSLPSSIALPASLPYWACILGIRTQLDVPKAADAVQEEEERLLPLIDERGGDPIVMVEVDRHFISDLPSLVVSAKETDQDGKAYSTPIKSTALSSRQDAVEKPDSLYRLSHQTQQPYRNVTPVPAQFNPARSWTQQQQIHQSEAEDEILLSMRDSLSRLGNISSDIAVELEEHDGLLNEVDDSMAEGQSMLDIQQKQIERLLQRTGWNHWKIIAVLLVITTVLCFLLLYG